MLKTCVDLAKAWKSECSEKVNTLFKINLSPKFSSEKLQVLKYDYSIVTVVDRECLSYLQKPLHSIAAFDLFQDEEKAKLTHSRLLELCRGVATEHVLHKYNIVDPSIAPLTSKPAKLVCQLYEKYGAREPGTAHQPPGTSANSAKYRQRSSLNKFVCEQLAFIYGGLENLRFSFKYVFTITCKPRAK